MITHEYGKKEIEFIMYFIKEFELEDEFNFEDVEKFIFKSNNEDEFFSFQFTYIFY